MASNLTKDFTRAFDLAGPTGSRELERVFARLGLHGGVRAALVAFLLCTAATVLAQGPDSFLSEPNRTDLSQKSINETITPSSAPPAGAKLTLKFVPADMISATPLKWTDGKATTSFKITSNAWGTVTVTLVDQDGKSYGSGPFDTGVYCLDATEKSNCALRFEIDTTAANGSSTQTNKNTAPDILFKLDYLWAKSKNSETVKKSSDASPRVSVSPHTFADRFTTHVTFDTGYKQITAATKLQPVTNSTAAPASGDSSASSRSTAASGTANSSSTPCGGTGSSSTSTSPSSCTAATPQQAFVAEAGATAGLTFGQDGQGTFYELGFAGRGAFQDLVQSNQVVQNGGLSYINLSSNNPRNAIGLYEGVFRFRVGALGHDAPAAAPKNTTNNPTSKLVTARSTGPSRTMPEETKDASKKSGSQKSTYSHNSSNFLVMEAGYQNNSGLQQLAANPMTNTRNRFVGRFYLYPPLPGTTQTKPVIGMEYSGGIAGGPKVVQIFFGLNLNPSKLIQNNKASDASLTSR